MPHALRSKIFSAVVHYIISKIPRKKYLDSYLITSEIPTQPASKNSCRTSDLHILLNATIILYFYSIKVFYCYTPPQIKKTYLTIHHHIDPYN